MPRSPAARARSHRTACIHSRTLGPSSSSKAASVTTADSRAAGEPSSSVAGQDIEFVPHNFGTRLGLIANAHLVAAAPETELLEYPVFEDDPALDGDGDPGTYPFDLAFDIIEGTPGVKDGTLTVPDGPGLGVDVNLDAVDDYPFVEGLWTEFHYDD